LAEPSISSSRILLIPTATPSYTRLTAAPPENATEAPSSRQLETAMTVSISDRVFDAVESTQPATASTLLRELGVSQACVQKQKAALGTWMMVHELGRPLRISLLGNGYGLLLKEIDARRSRLRVSA
jgi:hypothetical protein